jgi:Domain of unknown function (DUF4114)
MKNHHLSKPKTALAIGIALSLGAMATTNTAQAAAKPSCPAGTKWSYLTGYSSSDGKPTGMTDSSSLLPSDLLTRILKLLPEGKDITTNSVTNALIANDQAANVYVTKSTNIKIAFVTEGAGYSNALGYFKYDATNYATPCALNEKIIFPNASTPPMSSGNTVDLGTFNAGDVIGFTIVANGWQSGVVNPNKASTGIFRSVMAMNPETNGKNAHTVLLSSPTDSLLVLGFEDLNRQSSSYNDYGYGTDNDFNDVIIAIIATDFTAINTSNIPQVDNGVVTNTTTSKPLGISGRMNWREKADKQ